MKHHWITVTMLLFAVGCSNTRVVSSEELPVYATDPLMHAIHTCQATSMMPVPSHLTGSVRPKDSAIDETALDAEVVCGCGSRRFDLLYPGQTHEHRGQQIPCTAQIDGRFFFLIKARCTRCGRDHLLFDKDFHGWNGFVCHNEAKASVPRPPLTSWKCLSCGKTEHEASVRIQTEGRENFVEETDGEFDEERWPDGFGWFSMSIRCTGCGKHTPDWVSYETM